MADIRACVTLLGGAVSQSARPRAGAAVFTAVQLLTSGPTTARLLAGDAVRIDSGSRGDIAVFAPGRLVAYLVESPLRVRLYVLRTAPLLSSDSDLLVRVPGIHPEVPVLLMARSRSAVKKVGNLFGKWPTTVGDVQTLSDRFWLRLAGVLCQRRAFTRSVLAQLLADDSRETFS